jgi:putative transposase
MTIPQAVNQRWSLDFVSDALGDGCRFRALCVLDDFSRECLALIVDTSISGKRVARELDQLYAWRGRPAMIVGRQRHPADLERNPVLGRRGGCRVALHRPGKPVQNAFAESFIGRFRDECLNESLFGSLAAGRRLIAHWRADYNATRPHSPTSATP